MADAKLKLKCLIRRAGLADVPRPVLVCLAAAFVFLLGFALWRFWPAAEPAAGHDFSIEVGADDSTSTTDLVDRGSDAAGAAISVDVEGAVKSPGLYELASGSRVGDAIEAAGGMTKHAARGGVNLAALLEDGQQVVVPRKGSSSNGTGSKSSGSSASAGFASGGSGTSGKININSASAAELQQLSGIGVSLSAHIVDYRESNGPFASVDELSKVSGIGEARLAAIRDQICV